MGDDVGVGGVRGEVKGEKEEFAYAWVGAVRPDGVSLFNCVSCGEEEGEGMRYRFIDVGVDF